MTFEFRDGRAQSGIDTGDKDAENPARARRSTLDSRIVVLEVALCEYIGRFGMTEDARAALRLANANRPL